MNETTIKPAVPLDATTDGGTGVIVAVPDDLSSMTDAPATGPGASTPVPGADPPDGGGSGRAARHHLPWWRIVAVVAVVAVIAALTTYGMAQRSQLASRTRTLASTRTELVSTKAELDRTTATLASTRTSLDSTKAELATTQGQLAAVTAERERLSNQLGLAQADLARVTSIRDAMKAQLASAPKAIDNALNCWDADEATALAALAYLSDRITAAQLSDVIEAHNVGHSSGTCATAWEDLVAWHDGLRAFGISG